MATNLKEFDSVGGFSVDNTTVINNLKDVKNVNTLELKNSEFLDSTRTQYILRGTNTAILGTDAIGSQIILPSETINFITGHIIGVSSSGGANYSLKIESIVSCNEVGNVQVLSGLTTIIKDSIPTGQNWTATVDVISILWL
jgi:hypothetical protein